jgi:hypothetical protein
MARPTGGLWIDPLVLDREGGMKWRVMIELAGAEGPEQLHEVSAGGSTQDGQRAAIPPRPLAAR